jgi:hypothetical protein
MDRNAFDDPKRVATWSELEEREPTVATSG